MACKCHNYTFGSLNSQSSEYTSMMHQKPLDCVINNSAFEHLILLSVGLLHMSITFSHSLLNVVLFLDMYFLTTEITEKMRN